MTADATKTGSGRLFPDGLPAAEWCRFPAEGFKSSVAGLVFDLRHPACCGVALGGLGTGCLNIETSGALGYSCIFNPPDSPRGRGRQLMLPFLGVSVDGVVYVLTAQKLIEGGRVGCCTDPIDPMVKGSDQEYWSRWQTEVPAAENVRSAKEIRYWGHYPVADLEYGTDAPLSIGLRAWTPTDGGRRTAPWGGGLSSRREGGA